MIHWSTYNGTTAKHTNNGAGATTAANVGLASVSDKPAAHPATMDAMQTTGTTNWLRRDRNSSAKVPNPKGGALPLH